jgi:hypothetical protein
VNWGFATEKPLPVAALPFSLDVPVDVAGELRMRAGFRD